MINKENNNLTEKEKLNKNVHTKTGTRNGNNTEFNEKFIKSYIGQNADKIYDSIKKGGINIWALLFGVVYFVYRKMYLISLVLVIVNTILIIYVPSVVGMMNTIEWLMFGPFYRWDVTRKLRKIKKNNITKDEQELLSMAQKKGGTSLVGAIVFTISYVLVAAMYFK